MKRILIKTYIGTALLTLFLVGCSDILEEQPRSIFTPGYFKTEKGVMGGLTAMYSHLRYIYGPAYYYNTGVTGTDEATYAQEQVRLLQAAAVVMHYGDRPSLILTLPAV